MSSDTLRIDGRYCGPPRSRNGGCVCGRLADHIDGRKRFAGSAVFGASGRAVAVARATWIEVEEKPFADA